MLLRFIVSVFFLQQFSNAQSHHYVIDKQFNGRPTGHADVSITLQENDSENHMRITVKAPFYNDRQPIGPPGKPTPKIWHHEVAEVYFLNENSEYLQILIGPYGHYLVILFMSEKNSIKRGLEMEVRTSLYDGYWEGEAIVPGEYFPPKVSRFNAFIQNGQKPKRRYWALYPAEDHVEKPDFHNLKYFKAIDLKAGFANQEDHSNVWREALESSETSSGLELSRLSTSLLVASLIIRFYYSF